MPDKEAIREKAGVIKDAYEYDDIAHWVARQAFALCDEVDRLQGIVEPFRNAKPVTAKELKDLFGGWPEDEDFDRFIETIRRGRSNPEAGAYP